MKPRFCAVSKTGVSRKSCGRPGGGQYGGDGLDKVGDGGGRRCHLFHTLYAALLVHLVLAFPAAGSDHGRPGPPSSLESRGRIPHMPGRPPRSGGAWSGTYPRRTGYVPDRFPPRLRFTPAEYLGHIGRIQGLPDRRVHMVHLSKGNCRKAALAQALLADPGLLVHPDGGTRQGRLRGGERPRESTVAVIADQHPSAGFSCVWSAPSR